MRAERATLGYSILAALQQAQRRTKHQTILYSFVETEHSPEQPAQRLTQQSAI